MKLEDLRILYFQFYVVLLRVAMSISAEKLCHNFYSNAKNHLSTKTPYTYVANYDDSPVHFDGCTPVKMWAIIRHGTRNPGKGLIEKMRVHLPALKSIIIDHHESGRGNLCPEVIEQLRTWEPSVDPSELKFLTHEGEEEMILLGERFQNRFPDLLPETYSDKTYSFRHTATQRTRESAQHFTIGLFGRKQKSHVWYPEPLAKDPILRFYKLCDKWRVEVDKNPNSLNKLEHFQQSNHTLKMLQNISERIGLTHRLKFDDAKVIYKTCAFETAWHPKKPSPWCGLLSKDDFEVMEYTQDLEYYLIDGYGYSINYQQACVAVNDMFKHLMDDIYPPNTFYFTHSGTMLKVLAYLGLYMDSEPLQSNEINKSRLWKTSKIDTFGSSIAFVLFKCDERYEVLTLHQERPVVLPGCDNSILCPLDKMKDLYKQDCDFHKMCRLDRDL